VEPAWQSHLQPQRCAAVLTASRGNGSRARSRRPPQRCAAVLPASRGSGARPLRPQHCAARDAPPKQAAAHARFSLSLIQVIQAATTGALVPIASAVHLHDPHFKLKAPITIGTIPMASVRVAQARGRSSSWPGCRHRHQQAPGGPSPTASRRSRPPWVPDVGWRGERRSTGRRGSRRHNY
jgi:hypothetical protein